MSYIGGSQFSVDNRGDNELFSCIDRADMMEKIKADIMPMGYTGRVQANSSANYARNYYGQLENAYGVNDRNINLYQYTGFMDDKINASSRATQSASRFNYAYDRQINKRYVDVSGQKIANNDLRIIPNRSCMMNGAFPLTKPPYDANLERLAIELMGDNNITNAYDTSSANKYYTYKTNRPKLTRQDLMNSANQYAMSKPQLMANPSNPSNSAAIVAAISAVQPPVYSARTAQLLESARRRRDAAAAGALSIDIPV